MRPSVLGVVIAVCWCVGLLLALEPAIEEPIEELRLVEDPPEDPVPVGSCALLLRLVDADSGEPIREWIDLWQLDAPGNEHWTRGDQLRLGRTAPRAGLCIYGLPEGRYRVFCAARLDRSWYEVPITVRAWLEGYEDLEFEVLPGERPRPHRLVPKR